VYNHVCNSTYECQVSTYSLRGTLGKTYQKLLALLVWCAAAESGQQVLKYLRGMHLRLHLKGPDITSTVC
jgi:hypothetical protein